MEIGVPGGIVSRQMLQTELSVWREENFLLCLAILFLMKAVMGMLNEELTN